MKKRIVSVLLVAAMAVGMLMGCGSKSNSGSDSSSGTSTSADGGTFVVPVNLADSLEATSDDGMHYNLKLKDGLKWHDGEPITADDVVFTIDMFKDTSNTGATSESVTYNGKTISAEKVDDLNVAFTLQEPLKNTKRETLLYMKEMMTITEENQALHR